MKYMAEQDCTGQAGLEIPRGRGSLGGKAGSKGYGGQGFVGNSKHGSYQYCT